jgi:hypothetical protein
MKAYEEIIDFIATRSSPGDLLLFKPSAESQQRVSELLELEREGKINDSEKSELDDFLKLEHIIRLSKARARKYAQVG